MKKGILFILPTLIIIFILYFGFFQKKNNIESDDNKSDSYYKTGCVYLNMGEYAKAYEFAMLSYLIEKKDTQSKKYAETLNLIGNIYEKTGLYIKSLEIHYESLEIQKLINNEKGIANSYHNIANINMMAERYDIAYNYYSKALKIYESLYIIPADSSDIKTNLIKIYISIGNYFITQNDSIQAFNYLDNALEISKKANDKLNMAQSLLYIANVYFQCNDYSKAGDYYKKSLEINSEENNKISIVINNINLGKIYYLNNQVQKAIEKFDYSLDIATEINAKKQIAEVSELLYSLYSEFPDSIQKTKKYATIFLRSKRYLPNEVIQDSIIQLSVKYEVTAKKNEEISLLKYKMKIKAVLLFFLLIIVIVVTIFIFYYNKIRQRAIYERKLSDEQMLRIKDVFSAIEQERKRIAIDLHDSLGQILTATKLNLSGLEDLFEHQNKNKQKLFNDSINLLDQSCSELRSISYNIMPGALIKFGLKSAIEEIIHKINDSSKIKISFKANGLSHLFNETSEILIYRIVQEILNNIMKHANATLVNINIIKEPDFTILSIYDNGVGMENVEMYMNKGLGWKSIFSRVQMINGKIEINTGINKGTKIDIVIPDLKVGDKS